MSGIVNKVKEALHGDSHKHDNNVPEGTHGPHGSRTANAADPRVDSDLDGSRRTAGTHTTGTHTTGTHTTGTHTGAHAGTHAGSHTVGSSNVPEGTYGPHGSRVANAADPRVDSDMDRTGHHAGATRTAGYGEFGSSNTYGTQGTHAAGAGSGVTGITGTHGAPTGTYGTHNSRVANAADPRIDSDRDGRAALGHAPGPATNTAGPHKNDMLNKVDPRVDSDMDGSRTVGGNKTYQSGSSLSKDPTDAAQVPPSVLRKHVGDPAVEHEDAHHGRERRNSTRTHQESFSGI